MRRSGEYFLICSRSHELSKSGLLLISWKRSSQSQILSWASVRDSCRSSFSVLILGFGNLFVSCHLFPEQKTSQTGSSAPSNFLISLCKICAVIWFMISGGSEFANFSCADWDRCSTSFADSSIEFLYLQHFYE